MRRLRYLSPFLRLSRTLSTRTPTNRPWFVDECDSLSNPIAPLKPPPPPPKVPSDAPLHVKRAVDLLAQSPLIDPTTVTVGSPLPADAQPDGDFPLPFLKKARKARGKGKERGYGKGVGEGSGQGVYQWEIIGQVKEGSEARGAVDLVAASLRNRVRFSRLAGWKCTLPSLQLRREFPALKIPSRSHHKGQKDGWSLVDVGQTAIHVCSRQAWARYLDPTREW